MSEIGFITPVIGESHNLELHTELCAQRYNQLITKFEEVDDRLTKIEVTLEDINKKLGYINTGKLETYLRWAGVVIMSLTAFVSGLVSWIITH